MIEYGRAQNFVIFENAPNTLNIYGLSSYRQKLNITAPFSF